MYTYKCYYHPKDDSEQSCRGCKLPVCATCQGPEGFCPECVRKRTAVEHLRQLRVVMNAHPTATTTGRLRLARRASSEAGTSRKLALSGSLGPGTRPLTPPPPPPKGSSALPREPLRPARQKPENPQERRYNMDKVAYRPVAPQKDRYVKPARKKAARPQARPARPAAEVRPSWFVPFMVGLGVGVLLMVTMLLARPFMTGPAPEAPRAATQLTAREEAVLERVLQTPVVDSLAETPRVHPVSRARAAAPRAAYRPAAHRPAVRKAAEKRRPTLEEAMVFTTVQAP